MPPRLNSIARAVTSLAVLLSFAGCGRTPASPTRTNGSVVPPGPTWTVSGTVWVAGTFGLEPATRGDAFAWIESGAPGDGGQATGSVPIAVDGHYELTIPAGTKRVRLQGPLYQPCAVTLEPMGDAVADIYIVRDESMLGAHLPAALVGRPPTLSGEAYELSSGSSSSAGGRRPLANVLVLLDAFYGDDHVVARTRTDAEGRYVFCNVPFFPGLTVVAGLDGFELFVSSGDLTGRSTLDIELRRKQG